MAMAARRLVVVDANVAVAWAVQEPYTPWSSTLLAQWEQTGVLMLAPALFAAEVASTLRLSIKMNKLDESDAREALAFILETVTIWPHDRDLAARALSIARTINHTFVYDAMYIALAERAGCELWTADKRLYNGARAAFSFVRLVGSNGDAGGGR